MEWISVDKQLPEYDKEVLVYCDYKNWYSLGHLHCNNESWVCNPHQPVTHWMLLPPGPI
jgi:hypothetical protein